MPIREASLDEVRSVTEFMKNFEGATQFVKVDVDHAVNKYKGMISNGNGHMFILEDDNGKMIGGLGCVVGDDLHFPRKIAIETYWFVHPDNRGEGLSLLRYFEQWAKDNGCDAVAMIHLTDSMPETLDRLYTRRGYKMIERHYIKEV